MRPTPRPPSCRPRGCRCPRCRCRRRPSATMSISSGSASVSSSVSASVLVLVDLGRRLVVGGRAVAGAHARRGRCRAPRPRAAGRRPRRASRRAALLGDDVDVERQRLHLLEQDLEGLGDRRLGDVLALDDRLVGLHAPDGVVGLDREHLLQRVRGAVGLERPHLHLAEALAAELRLAAQRLLGDERVRAGRARVDLVVHEVQQLQDVHVADGHLLLERLAGAAVEERELARGLLARAAALVDVHADRALCAPPASCTSASSTSSTRRAVEHRRGHVDLAVAAVGALRLLVGLGAVVVPALRGDPPEVGLEDLADVHAARHAERVEDHVDGRAVLEERHVLLVDDLGDDALVAVAAGELVALGDLALLGHEHAHEVVDARAAGRRRSRARRS